MVYYYNNCAKSPLIYVWMDSTFFLQKSMLSVILFPTTEYRWLLEEKPFQCKIFKVRIKTKSMFALGFDTSLMLSLMDTEMSLIVKVLWTQISFLYFRVQLEVCVHKNPTCFSCWSVRKEKGADIVVVDMPLLDTRREKIFWEH